MSACTVKKKKKKTKGNGETQSEEENSESMKNISENMAVVIFA